MEEYNLQFFYFCFFVVLGIKPMALPIVGKCSTTELYTSHVNVILINLNFKTDNSVILENFSVPAIDWLCESSFSTINL
jgi:hypothetical protein